MATSWKSQQGEGTHSLQFETDSKEKYKLVEKAAQMAIDGKTIDDVDEVRHGHWEWGGDRFRCSVCDSAIPKVKTNKKAFINATYKYCRWCGAKMDGKDEKR